MISSRVDNFEQVKDHVADYSMVLAPQNYVVYFQRKGLSVARRRRHPRCAAVARLVAGAHKARRLPEALQQHGKKYFLLMPLKAERYHARHLQIRRLEMFRPRVALRAAGQPHGALR